ncbi:hypothetical protein J1N35_014683 [Gossypium stocksii]|uniref:Uncharacterized protein n=1 Tax=Gossypium stocksii TaxID=47602 RepID=A0A9D4AA50_9ROSI|nr:hypothetical protein J1N35_014683 [Gossypium stocksii]
MARELICLDHKHISIEQMKMSSITVDRKLLEGSKFLAHGQYRPRVQVGPKTHQCVHREVETRDAYIPSSMQRVYHHFGGRAVIIGVVGGWVHTHRSAQFVDWGAICYDLLGAIPDNITDIRSR